MRYLGFAYAARNGLLRDYLQWALTGTSPHTRPVDLKQGGQ